MRLGRLAAAGGIAGPYNGVVQRIAVTIALTAEILMAGRMLTLLEAAPAGRYADAADG